MKKKKKEKIMTIYNIYYFEPEVSTYPEMISGDFASFIWSYSYSSETALLINLQIL